MDQVEQQQMGYDSGLQSIDFTHGMVQEGINFITIGTTDIRQVFHLGAYGPCTPLRACLCAPASNA